jgi:hypothetical protein
LLVVLCEEEPRSEPYGRVALARLARVSDLGSHQELLRRTLRELESAGLSRIQGQGAEAFATPTESGREKARDLAAVPPSGRVDEFAEGLDDVKKAILDTVARLQLRIPGGTLVKRSTIRTSVRKVHPHVDIAAATAAIEQLAPSHLNHVGGAEVSYQMTLRGLLGSAWGVNALGVVDQVLSLVESLHTADSSVHEYSWRMLRTRAKLPQKALNLAYDTIRLTKLGVGLYEHNGERWWTMPPEPDALIEWKSGLAYAQSVVSIAGPNEQPAATAKAQSSKPPVVGEAVETGGREREVKPLPRPKYTIFISSTQQDLLDEREEVASEILKAEHIPCGMEQFSASPDRGWGIITDTIDLCDYYVLIIAGLYGSVDDETAKSWTQREYEYALEKEVPVLAFIRDDNHILKTLTEPDPVKAKKLSDFITHVQDKCYRERWTTVEDLRGRVAVALLKQIDRDARNGRQRPGWYRGDNLPVRGEVGEELARLLKENRDLHDREQHTAQRSPQTGRRGAKRAGSKLDQKTSAKSRTASQKTAKHKKGKRPVPSR